MVDYDMPEEYRRPAMRSTVINQALKVFFLMALAAGVVGCPDKKPKGPTCEKDKDCKEGEKCVNKRCQQCATDDDCTDGKSCKAGACVGECSVDGDCPNGQLCKESKCVACESDGQCGSDRRCSSGACLDRGACNVDEDCADDEDCIGGKCQRPGRDKPPEISCQLSTVYFGFNAFTVEGEAGTVLEKNAECIKQAPEGRTLFLNGHTDPRGTEEYNVALSEKRANAAADFIARLGIDPARFNVVPKGEGEASGSSEDGWAKDRRVDFEWK